MIMYFLSIVENYIMDTGERYNCGIQEGFLIGNITNRKKKLIY